MAPSPLVIAIDTNVLVYAHRAALAEHRAARRAIERAMASGGWGITHPTVAEFWSVATHPASAGRPSTPTQARAFLRAMFEDGGAHYWLPVAGFGERFLRLAADLGVTGSRIFDLQIAAIAYENGARELWSHDRNFLTVSGLRVVDPLD
jgi:toxin-antitoxin system PIN domain toxin